MKEKYLLKIKNAMFWHFSSVEIRTTLTDINAYFESALQDGLSEEEIINQYGSPQAVVRELQQEMQSNTKRHCGTLWTKYLLLSFCALGALFSWVLCPLPLAGNLFVIWTSVILWFCAGNNCIVGTLTIPPNWKRQFWKSQVILFLSFLILQGSSFFLLPEIIQKSHQPVSLGNGIRFGVYAILAILLLAIGYFLKEMLLGNSYLFFAVIQAIALICSLLLYYDYLKRLDSLIVSAYLLTPYLTGIAVSLLLVPYFIRQQK